MRFIAILSIAHVVMAGFVTALVYQVGSLIAPHVADRVAVVLCLVAALVAAFLDANAIRTDSFAPGLQRQTSKELGHRENMPTWVAPMIWGLDTGLMWSTFRVSATTWVLLAAALLNVAPQWSGLVFGIAFVVPLSVAVLIGRGSLSQLSRSGPRRLAQLAAIGVAIVPAVAVAATSVF
ncbi:hypothetical protein ACIBEF_00755 [Micromonospora sp. NPDC050795]|uniref:hypothetical protein n=1 Tax=Micromonospora sp. NPDC050795 TaxID=3364282 RepID=UPI0037B58B05